MTDAPGLVTQILWLLWTILILMSVFIKRRSVWYATSILAAAIVLASSIEYAFGVTSLKWTLITTTFFTSAFWWGVRKARAYRAPDAIVTK